MSKIDGGKVLGCLTALLLVGAAFDTVKKREERGEEGDGVADVKKVIVDNFDQLTPDHLREVCEWIYSLLPTLQAIAMEQPAEKPSLKAALKAALLRSDDNAKS